MELNWLKPDWDSGLPIHMLPLTKLRDKGIKGLILDVDGTLLSGRSVALQTDVLNWLNEAKESFHLHLLSNNPSEERIRLVANQLMVDYTFKALKPRRKKITQVCQKINEDNMDLALIGDRIFTDVIGGNRLGLYTVLVKPIAKGRIIESKLLVQGLERTLSKLLGVNLL